MGTFIGKGEKNTTLVGKTRPRRDPKRAKEILERKKSHLGTAAEESTLYKSRGKTWGENNFTI